MKKYSDKSFSSDSYRSRRLSNIDGDNDDAYQDTDEPNLNDEIVSNIVYIGKQEEKITRAIRKSIVDSSSLSNYY